METVNSFKPDEITITAKPSASKSLPYIWSTHTWVNYCPNCHHYNTLTVNPKGTYEGELTCSRCDSDYCGVTGKEKGYRGTYLTKAKKKVKTVAKKTKTRNTNEVSHEEVFNFLVETSLQILFKNNINYEVKLI